MRMTPGRRRRRATTSFQRIAGAHHSGDRGPEFRYLRPPVRGPTGPAGNVHSLLPMERPDASESASGLFLWGGRGHHVGRGSVSDRPRRDRKRIRRAGPDDYSGNPRRTRIAAWQRLSEANEVPGRRRLILSDPRPAAGGFGQRGYRDPPDQDAPSFTGVTPSSEGAPSFGGATPRSRWWPLRSDSMSREMWVPFDSWGFEPRSAKVQGRFSRFAFRINPGEYENISHLDP